MLIKPITYKSLDGDMVTEDFHFNLSKVEIIELQFTENGFGEHLLRIIKSGNGDVIMKTFKKIIRMSYGERQGRSFMKSDALSDGFMCCPAYEALFMELVTNPDKAAEFVNGIMPKGFEEEVAKLEGAKADNVELPADTNADEPLWLRENRAPTQKELTLMSKEEMQRAFQWRAENPGA